MNEYCQNKLNTNSLYTNLSQTLKMINEKLKVEVLKISENVDKNLLTALYDYNVGGGKEFRFKAYVHIVNSLKPEVAGDETILGKGYTVELIQAAFLIIDDIMDNSKVRRGKPCYYLNRGLVSMKDAMFLLAVVKKILKSYDLKKVSAEEILRTGFGQTHDSLRKTRSGYNLESYYKICENKTGAYTLYLPIALAYLVSGVPLGKELRDFSRVGGSIFQIEDDYLNFLPKESNKSSNDLEEMKCTWFTSKLAPKVDNDAVNKYFEEEVITDELMNMIKAMFKECKETIDSMIEELKQIVEMKNNRALEIFINLLEKRNIQVIE